MIRKFLIAAAAAVAAPATSQAVFLVTFQETGFVPLVVFDATVPPPIPGAGVVFDTNGSPRVIEPGTSNGPGVVPRGDINFGSFLINLSATATETPVFSNVVNSTVAITNTSGAAATITILVAETQFFQPGDATSTLFLTTTLSVVSLTPGEGGGTLPGGGLATLSGTTTVDDAGPSAGVSTPLLGGPGTQFANLQQTPPADAVADTSATVLFDRSQPFFNMTNTATITLAAGATLTFQSSGVVFAETPVIPVPAGLVMAATAVPFFGLIRRRLRGTEAPTAA